MARWWKCCVFSRQRAWGIWPGMGLHEWCVRYDWVSHYTYFLQQIRKRTLSLKKETLTNLIETLQHWVLIWTTLRVTLRSQIVLMCSLLWSLSYSLSWCYLESLAPMVQKYSMASCFGILSSSLTTGHPREDVLQRSSAQQPSWLHPSVLTFPQTLFPWLTICLHCSLK